jgi:hypothetical protein
MQYHGAVSKFARKLVARKIKLNITGFGAAAQNDEQNARKSIYNHTKGV